MVLPHLGFQFYFMLGLPVYCLGVGFADYGQLSEILKL